jgi:RNA polymerase sigma-70 factor (ECF subfamily)
VPPGVEKPVVGRPRTEEELITLAREGDADAFAELVRPHLDLAFRTAMLITRNATDAEDAAQEGLAKAWRALTRFDRGRPVRPWLLTIVANQARDRRRSAGRREGLWLRAAGEERPDGETALSPEAALLAGETRGDLLAGLGSLREEDRLVLGCRFLLDLSEADTAAALGVRPGTVKSRTSRALARLREVVDRDA